MKPYFSDDLVTLYLGDCLAVLATMDDASVDAVVCDPPYDLTSGKKGGSGAASLNEKHPAGRSRIGTGGGFMGKEWDATGVAFDPETWRAVLRVLKPGGHLLAFGGSRTWHRMVCAIEDAGFEIRDPIADLTGMDAPGLLWIQGQGYPKNLNVAKEIDKRRFGSGDVAAFKEALARAVTASGKTRKQINDECGFTMRFDISYEKDPIGWGCSLPTVEQYDVICRVLDVDGDREAVAALREWPRTTLERLYRVVGYEERSNSPSGLVQAGQGESTPIRRELTVPGTEQAARWEGWGTALKPAWEPIAVGRKPLTGTVTQNVLQYGTGAYNLAACKVGTETRVNNAGGTSSPQRASRVEQGYRPTVTTSSNEDTEVEGRWPPNLVIGETAAAELDRQSGVLTSGANPARRGSDKFRDAYGDFAGQTECVVHRGADSGGASRFFPVFRYEPKAPKTERPKLPDGTAWPTVKPLDLMRWLVRLVTPPDGLVLDLFAGSGPTGEACVIEGFPCILIDKDPVAAELIKTRLSKPIQPLLFGGAA